MTHTTEQERAHALAEKHGATSYRNRADTSNPAFGFTLGQLEALISEVEQAARRAPVVPQGWKLVPDKPTADMLIALMQWDSETGLTILPQYKAMLAAAPQPPYFNSVEFDTIKTEAAPVQMPEPWAISHHNRVQYSNAAWHGETPDGTKLYTEQQVRPLLAAQKFQLDELAMLTRKLVRSLRKAAPDNESAEKALDYLKRKGLGGNPPRSTQEQST